jgi:soluble lytic murein transglycosylase
MPRIPTLNDLGARPIPRSNRAIATVRNAGAVADAVGDLGGKAAAFGQGMLEKEDKLNFAAAQAEYMREDIATRAELEADPDYGTFDKRYTERMAVAKQRAASLIKSKSDRSLFDAANRVDFERGRAAVLGLARGKETTAGLATLETTLDTLHDNARLAPDEATRALAIQTANETINGAVAKGYMNPVQAVEAREKWTAGYVTEQAMMMLNREEPEAAKAYIEKNAGFMDWKTRLSLEERTAGMLDKREASNIVDSIMGAATNTGDAAVAYSDPLRGRGNGVSSEYGERRATGVHNGVDFTGRVGTPVYSIGAGVVKKVGRDARSGNFVIIDHGNGRTSSYSHMQDGIALKEGDAVTPDTTLGGIGMTGKTTGPHVHVVVKDNGATIDPVKVIENARQPRRHDLTGIYAQIDAVAEAQGWTPEKTERVRQEADRRVARDETLVKRDEDTAMRSALDVIDELGDGFTDISQIPNAGSLSASDRIRLKGIAEQNRKPKEVLADGDTYLGLKQMRIHDGAKFKATDLRRFRAEMTRAEFDELTTKQAEMQEEKPVNVSLRSGITSTISLLATPDMKLTGVPARNKTAYAESRADYLRVYDIMETELRQLTGGKRTPTDAEYNQAFQSATRSVAVKYDTSFIGIPTGQSVREKPRYDLDAGDIPPSVRQRIERDYREVYGTSPDDEKIAGIYIKYKGTRW